MLRAAVLMLCLQAALGAEFQEANRKRRAPQLAAAQVSVPITDEPATVTPNCQGTCGGLNQCQQSCDTNQQEYDNSQCSIGCKCCGPRLFGADDKLAFPVEIIPVFCDGSQCGGYGVCRRDCGTHHEIQIPGECRGGCMCCSRELVPTDCEFNGKMYRDGEQLPGVCIGLICQQGQWVSNGYINDCCRKCNVKDDPHFTSYDGLAFDFHGTCNYSITQYGISYNPPFGVFGDFRPCNSLASCTDVTTFKDNANTVITMTYAGLNNINVNGVGYTVTPVILPLPGHSVLAWQVGNCIRLLGTQRLVVEYCWTGIWRQVYLYAHPSLSDKLYGLCGFFDYYMQNDLTHRDLTVTLPTYYPIAFGNSWTTSEQSDPICLLTNASSNGGATQTNGQDGGEDPCIADAYIECYKVLSAVNYDGHPPTEEQLDIHSRFCATDLCAFRNSPDDQTDIEAYFQAISDMLQTTVEHDVMTTPGARPREEFCIPCTGACANNAVCRFHNCEDSEEEVLGECPSKFCKCCRKSISLECESHKCGCGGICRSCSCLEGEEQISGDCKLGGCICCRKKKDFWKHTAFEAGQEMEQGKQWQNMKLNLG